MRFLEMTGATDTLADYARKAITEPIIITISGKPVAVLVAIENADKETISVSTNPKFIDIIERSRAHQKAKGGLSSEEVRSQLGL